MIAATNGSIGISISPAFPQSLGVDIFRTSGFAPRAKAAFAVAFTTSIFDSVSHVIARDSPGCKSNIS